MKRSSLLGLFVSYKENEVLWIRTQGIESMTNFEMKLNWHFRTNTKIQGYCKMCWLIVRRLVSMLSQGGQILTFKPSFNEYTTQ